MASLQTKADAVKAAIASIESCTTTTVVSVKELLLADTDTTSASSRPASRISRAPGHSRAKKSVDLRSTSAKTATTITTSSTTTSSTLGHGKAELSSKEKAALATHIINAGIKSLTEAAKPPQPSTPCKRRPSNGDVRKTAETGTRTLRRSTSAPLSPLAPKSLNRVATSPSTVTKTTKLGPAAQPSACLATVECLRAAFACLRSIKGAAQPKQTDFQLETGMSAFVGKLLALGLHDPALKELRVLKKRLDIATSDAAKSAKAASAETAAQVIGELLDYSEQVPDHSLAIITACQVQVIRLISISKKPAYIEAALPYLVESHPSSPLNLLLRLAKQSEKEVSRAARQLATLSQTILALAPSVSSKEDHVATEPRLSPSPNSAFQLQCLAFKTQLRWWKLAGHRGVVDDEVFSPFVRCARAFTRRQKPEHGSAYSTLCPAFNSLMQLTKSQKSQPKLSSDSPLASIYQLLGSVTQTERLYSEAYQWFQSLKALMDAGSESFVRRCCVTSRLLSVSLKRSDLGSDVEDLIREVTESLDAPLSGSVSELNELLESLSSARRSAVGLLVNSREKTRQTPIPNTINHLLKTLILRYPRFARRWLGAPPGRDAAAKQILQFDQRRQVLLQSISQILDAALVVTNGDVQGGTMAWELMDDTLQECTALLDSVADPTLSASRTEQLGTYYVKISSLYFSNFLQLRKETTKSKELNKQILQSLSRSIEAVKERSLALQEKAQLPTKLELFADLCKGAGRSDDAVRSLRSICTNMIEEGALAKVTASLSSQPATLAWSVDEKAETLSRTLRSIAKLDKSWNDWAFFLPELERAAVLEHLMYISAEPSSRAQLMGLHSSPVQAILRIYTVDRFPVRRLRVLLHLLSQNLGESSEVEEIKSHADQVLEHVQHKALAEDAALARYVCHFQAYSSSLSALATIEVPFPMNEMKDAIASWKSMTEHCQTRADLYDRVDNPEALINHLQSANQFAELRGESNLQLSVLELSAVISKAFAEPTCNGLILNHTLLASQHLIIGHYSEAKKALELTKELVGQAKGVSRGVMASFYLSQAEYFAGVGDLEEANVSLMLAKEICDGPTSAWAQSKSQANMALALVSFIASTMALKQGYVQEALSCIKSSVRILSHDWAKAEASFSRESSPAETSISETSISENKEASAAYQVVGPRYWGLAFPLLRGLLHLSAVYAHLGMFQETVYYAESAQKIAESTNSPLYRAQVAAWTASIYHRAEKLDKALELGNEARQSLPSEVSASRVQLACQLSDLYRDLDSNETAAELLKMAEDTAQQLGSSEELEKTQKLSEKPSATATRGRSTTATSTTKATRTTRSRAVTATSMAARAPKRTPAAKVTKAKAAPPKDVANLPKDVYQASLMTSVILCRALGLISQKDWSSAISTLEQVKELPKLFATLSQEQVVTAISLIGHSTEQMIHDPVFSVIQDSTISFPAVAASFDKSASERQSPSPPRKGRSTDRKGSKERGLPVFADALRRAQEILLEAHTSTLATADSTMVHRISALLQNTVILLSATTTTKSKAPASSGLATFSVDLARNITWRREQSTLQTPRNFEKAKAQAASSRRQSLGLTAEMSQFQTNYVDLLPENWSAISISLSDNRHDLCITKFQAGHSPFILRLPLERANSRDADSEVFNFSHGREEMLEIIEQANETSHSAKDFTTKGARSSWWAEREALDTRLKELLDCIETTWLGGFKGIFSQHQRRPDLLARFQTSFQQILDNSLPSRNKLRGKKTSTTPKITLDPRILDLFIGLGDPAEPDGDFDEALNDLLYFVVDILQFHGERNAYDEIDFDAMVVETTDALRGYYEASKCEGERAEGAHTVLVLDKALHVFPWESMPCMEGLAVSRVPSLACLRQLIVEAVQSTDEGQPGGHYVSAERGTYILNPSSDLKNTQATFQPTFKSLPTWTSVVNRAPSEADFEEALSSSDILLYFGHGSGAQYVRARTVRRLDKCRPATFLMGCSSAALTEAGEFEVYGPVWNYMMAGCPAVVGTLWDVTDRDIDRFAGKAFEHWGLFPHGTFQDEKKAKGKKRAVEDDGSSDGSVSLAEAVARARNVCRFKYLNAAAVVLYGIPVYIGKRAEE